MQADQLVWLGEALPFAPQAKSTELPTLDRPVTLLNGDIARKHLSSELGFYKEHWDLNIRHIDFVAREITKNWGLSICAPIAPLAALRREVRNMISQCGGY